MSIEAKPRKIIEKPRISVNKLAEYLEAHADRRKKIVQDAKYPAGYITARYKDAREAIKDYIRGVSDEDAILSRIDEFESAIPDSDWQENDNASSAEALKFLLDTDISCWEEFEIEPFEGENTLIEISGVGISVHPDLVVRMTDGASALVGLIKLHLAKNNELSEESQKIVAILLYQFAGQFIADETDGEIATPKCCISFDVFRRRSEYCPTAVKMRVRKIETACEEIALWWGKL